MSGQRGGKTLIITDDEEEHADDLNPFSFNEFLRWKNQEQNLNLNQDQAHRKEEDWGRCVQSGVETTLCTEEEEVKDVEEDELLETRFCSKPVGGTASGQKGENDEGDDETSMTDTATSSWRLNGKSSQIQQLMEENASLRRTIKDLQRRTEVHQHRVLELSEELLQRRRQEEKEAQDLESMVHSVEQNLQLMTKRAVKAESSVSRLKAELQQLQVEAVSLRSENNHLKAAESQVIMTMKQNAQLASEYLSKSASHAHSSIRRLLGEAETLRLVSQLLQSIDKVSTINTES